MNTRLGALPIAPLAFLALATPAMAEEFEGRFTGAAAGYSSDVIGPELGGTAAPGGVGHPVGRRRSLIAEGTGRWTC
jgi:hypothetical protein